MDNSNKSQSLELVKELEKGNHFVLYVYKKICRISNAIYLITDTMKDIEPLKWELRKCAIRVSNPSQFRSENFVLNDIESALVELEAILAFARDLKAVSFMNAKIVGDRIKDVILEMRQEKANLFAEEKLAFPNGFFDVDVPLIRNTGANSEAKFESEIKESAEHKSHKGHNVLYDFYKPKMGGLGGASIHKKERHFESSDEKTRAVGDKNSRKEEILNIIKAKGVVTIKDITELVKDCSEKTIQRELTDMVLSRAIKKTGERRWSRYSVF